MDLKHTPGPLDVRMSEVWPFNIETFDASGEKVWSEPLVAHSSAQNTPDDARLAVGFKPHEVEGVRRLIARQLADAALRAAAPDLLEALRPFAEACGHLHPSQPDDGETLDGFKVRDFRAAAAAIAKATQPHTEGDVK
jgi:hypothetical protein